MSLDGENSIVSAVGIRGWRRASWFVTRVCAAAESRQMAVPRAMSMPAVCGREIGLLGWWDVGVIDGCWSELEVGAAMWVAPPFVPPVQDK